jgi:hypothetical protein
VSTSYLWKCVFLHDRSDGTQDAPSCGLLMISLVLLLLPKPLVQSLPVRCQLPRPTVTYYVSSTSALPPHHLPPLQEPSRCLCLSSSQAAPSSQRARHHVSLPRWSPPRSHLHLPLTHIPARSSGSRATSEPRRDRRLASTSHWRPAPRADSSEHHRHGVWTVGCLYHAEERPGRAGSSRWGSALATAAGR